MAITKEKAIEILEFFDFFQGQRAGRELWNDKPFDVQEEDIASFARDVGLLKEYIETADVVPKSEVEKEIKNWQELYADTVSKWEKAYEELEIKLENAKADVAMEIIDKIESIMFDRFSNIMLGEDIRLCLAELKKKYTEGETNG